MSGEQTPSRRPLKSRDTKWAAWIATRLARAGVRPNLISMASLVFAALAGIFLGFAGCARREWSWSIHLVFAAIGIQLRLLCNLLDGMVAIEGGFKTKTGEMFNELPDRFADVFIFIGAAYSVREFPCMRELGWAAATFAVITAYVRALGASMGAGQHFVGPMAKPHRMAVMTVACLAAALAPVLPVTARLIPLALAIVVAGCLITIFRRCSRIARELKSK